MRRTLATLLLTTAFTAHAETITRDDIVTTMKSEGCSNPKELSCLGIDRKACESYMISMTNECKDRLPERFDPATLSSKQTQSLKNFYSCASQQSQAQLGVSPEKAKRCAAAQ